MARPKAHEVRDHQVNFRLTGAEYQALRELAEDAGRSVMDYGRAALLAGTPLSDATRQVHIPTLYERQMMLLIQRLGVNANQIARHLNTHPDKPAPPELWLLITEIRAWLDEYREAYPSKGDW